LPILHLFPWILRKLTRRSFVAENLRRAHRVDVKRTPSNVPLSIHCHLREWFSSCLDAGVIRAPYDGMMAGNLTTLRSVGNDLYRIRTTPTPFAYQAHLRMITILFLIFFPLTMFETLGWSMVFAAALLAFIYFGLLDIARDL
jgi:putative membrane protein